MEAYKDLNDFIKSIERKELSEEQQLLLYSGGTGITVTASGNNILAGCVTNNCKGGNCGNCVVGCGN